MDGVPTRGLMQEVSETVLLLAICCFTLAGYLGVALMFVSALK